jgi:hypothetical protein
VLLIIAVSAAFADDDEAGEAAVFLHSAHAEPPAYYSSL